MYAKLRSASRVFFGTGLDMLNSRFSSLARRRMVDIDGFHPVCCCSHRGTSLPGMPSMAIASPRASSSACLRVLPLGSGLGELSIFTIWGRVIFDPTPLGLPPLVFSACSRFM